MPDSQESLARETTFLLTVSFETDFYAYNIHVHVLTL